MIKKRIVGYRYSVYERNADANRFFKQVEPKKYSDYVWIPQTMGDQVWIWFEFDTVAERKQYEKEMVDIGFDRWFMHKEKWLTQKEIWRWTETPEQKKAREEYADNLEARYEKEGLCKEFQAVIDCMTHKPNMDDAEERRLVLQSDDATRDLVDSGAWDDLDRFYVYASKLAKNKHDRKIDWKNPQG